MCLNTILDLDTAQSTKHWPVISHEFQADFFGAQLVEGVKQGVVVRFYLKLLTEFNPLSADPTKWSNILRQFVGKLPTNFLSVFDHFMGLALKGLHKTTNFYFPWNEETVLCWFQEEEKLFNLLKFA